MCVYVVVGDSKGVSRDVSGPPPAESKHRVARLRMPKSIKVGRVEGKRRKSVEKDGSGAPGVSGSGAAHAASVSRYRDANKGRSVGTQRERRKVR